jgi:hypothetical protein
LLNANSDAPREWVDFYQRRLARAMSAHLRGLRIMYMTAPFSETWLRKLDAIDAMMADIAPEASGELVRITIAENAIAI